MKLSPYKNYFQKFKRVVRLDYLICKFRLGWLPARHLDRLVVIMFCGSCASIFRYKYTRQQKKVCIPLWQSLKDFIFNVQNSHLKVCQIFVQMMGQTLFFIQYTFHYRPVKFRFFREKNSQKSQNRQTYSFSAKLFCYVSFSFFKCLI